MTFTTDKITRAKAYLTFCAQHHLYPNYTDFGVIVGNSQPRNNGPLLELVDLACMAEKVPMLSMLVCKKGTKLPIMSRDWGLEYKQEEHPYFGRKMTAAQLTAAQDEAFAYYGMPATERSAKSGRRMPITDEQVITVLKSNPKKGGSKAQTRYDRYVSGSTVAKALAVGITREDLRWDVAHGHIEIR